MTIRGLVIDDREQNINRVTDSFDLDFRTIGWTVSWESRRDVPSARSVIRSSEPFHFAVVDLDFSDDEQDGFPAVRELRNKSDHTYILVVTGLPTKFPGFVERAQAAGANEAILRWELLDDSSPHRFDRLVRQIRLHLVSRDVIEEGELKVNLDDPGMLSILESVGGGADKEQVERGLWIVRSLTMSCVESGTESDAGNLQLSYLVPGRSGAYVCRVDRRREGRPSESFVLKFGLDRAALDHELNANREAIRVLSEQTLVSVIGQLQRDPSGYSGFIARLADKAVPLSGWMVNVATPELARDVSRMLFGEHLAPLFEVELRQKRATRAWLATPALVRLRVRLALDQYRQVLTHPAVEFDGDVEEMEKTILDFVDSGTLPAQSSDSLAGHVIYVKGFGDLHSSNVLVQAGVRVRPILVDASRYGSHHWGWDAARLLTDVCLRLRCPGPEALMWDDFAESAAHARTQLCPICRQPDHMNEETATDTFVDAFLNDFSEFLDLRNLRVPMESWHWQWHVSLAKEFLRQCCHPDLPPPRRALAMVAAARHIRNAAGLIDAIKY